MALDFSIGIIGSGMLGAAIAEALWRAEPKSLLMANRSGARPDIEGFPPENVLTDPQVLVEACDVVILCVPPAAARDLRIDAKDKLVISVMAGVPLSELTRISASPRVIRAMSSPAAAKGLAYSPWFASDAVTEDDRARTPALFEACGQTDELTDEAQIDLFTAMTGPVPGFVAACAAAMARHAEDQGVPPEIADRAVRQLFLSAGQMMAEGPTPQAHVQEMIDYAGTTAKGLTTLRDNGFAERLAEGLAAATQASRDIY
ncbi:pyrroline-5-carboxylate reductase dimerization domain-containing protein [Thioclava sp. F36-6]|uniref:pyrroline-5-carboxylate reductase family protein n=1 Tax=Thioclava sp. F36-6 TaxID=1915316 RepID=UPI000997CD6A|nr:pyrroline-5-carboxylate reductase dimerization domain-containing protein [Thioclava sp. F36-6]OOY31288.1 pyrroline-5-carboxylate reductase [Thioclava sp. F36-6]